MSGRVLVIDDDSLIRELVAVLLAEDGLSVDSAEDVRSGLRLLYDRRPELVVLDIGLPDSDGYTALGHIRAMTDVPVLMVTGRTEEDAKARAIGLGANEYVEKPLAPDEFRARVRALLQRAPTRASGAAPAAGVDRELRLGETFGGYHIEHVLGRGGMGIVYRARHEGLDRAAALKVMPASVTVQDGMIDRFMGEWRTAAALSHPHIVPVYDAGEVDGRLFLAMQLVEGPDLARLVEREGPLDASRAVPLVQQAASALEAAHAAGVVHRDVKPANILVEDDRAYLTDFGLAFRGAAGPGISRPDVVVGTPAFISPEQVRGDKATAQSDLYALACTAYYLLTAAAPFDAKNDVDLMLAHVKEEPRPPSSLRADLPPALDDVFASALAKNPRERPAGVSGFVDALATACS